MTTVAPPPDQAECASPTGLQTLMILAKSPQPGRVKTRLTPDFSPGEAAALAGAAIRDTLAAARATGAPTLLSWDGPPTPWLPADVPRQAQRGDGFAERLDHGVQGPPARRG